jgi:hypothetical protein
MGIDKCRIKRNAAALIANLICCSGSFSPTDKQKTVIRLNMIYGSRTFRKGGRGVCLYGISRKQKLNMRLRILSVNGNFYSE